MKSNGYNKLIIEGDSTIIISMCQHIIHDTHPAKMTHSWKLLAFLEELPTLLARALTTLTYHVRRDANKVADYLENHRVENPNTDINDAWNNHITATLCNTCANLSLQDMTPPLDGVPHVYSSL